MMQYGGLNIVKVTSSHTVTGAEDFILCGDSAFGVTLTLPKLLEKSVIAVKNTSRFGETLKVRALDSTFGDSTKGNFEVPAGGSAFLLYDAADNIWWAV